MTRRSLIQTAAAAALWGRNSNAESAPWPGGTFRQLHIDAHFAQIPAPYADFDAEAAAEMLHAAGFQMVSCFAVCNGGYSYYPTQLGVTHPGLKRDFTGEFTAALRKRGIHTLAYVAVGPDRRYFHEHPDWAQSRSVEVAQMCTNSPWVEQALVPQLREIVERYQVDGFFFDGLITKFVRGACYCKYCREVFGGDIPTADNDPRLFAHYRFLSRKGARFADRVTAALKPGLAYVFNHIWVTHNPVQPPASVTQLVWEPVPPYPGVLSFDFSFEARYLSSLPGIANWSCMTTRGNGWGDYSLRDPQTFRHEAAVLLAGGGRPYFGDDSYPSGNPERAVYQVYGEVNRRTAQLEPSVMGCAPVKDVAVLLSADSIWSGLPLNPPREWIANAPSPGVAGTHKALVEEHVQFGILNSETLVASLDGYRALILPEQVILSARECDAIRGFVQSGGALLATGDTGTRDEHNQALADFALADVLGVRFLGRAESRRGYLRARIDGIPAMDIQVNGAYARIRTTTAKSLMELVPPTALKQSPAANAEGPGVTLHAFGKGNALYCAVPLFSAYHQDGTPVFRKLISWMLQKVHPPTSRAITLENAPLSVEATYNQRGDSRFVHLIQFGGDRRLAGAQRLQDFSTVEGIRVHLQCNRRPGHVRLAPDNQRISYEWNNGWASFAARPFQLHSVYRIDV